MTMPSSGALNMGGTSSPVSVAQELGLSLTATISMNDANVRTLAGVGGSGTSWSMSSLYGKSNGPNLASWTRRLGNSLPTNFAWGSDLIAYSSTGAKYFMAFSGVSGGYIVSSTDLNLWTLATTVSPPFADTSGYVTAKYTNGSTVLVFGTLNGYLYYSTNSGTSWSGKTPLAASQITGIEFNGTNYVFVNTNGQAYYSTNLSTWTAGTGITTTMKALAWNGTVFCAVGSSGRIFTSPTGATWTLRSSGTANSLNGIAWSGSLFCAAGDSGVILTSPDGTTWTAQTSGTTNFLYNVTWGNGAFAVTTSAYNQLYTSSNGITWAPNTAVVNMYNNSISYVEYVNSQYIVYAASGILFKGASLSAAALDIVYAGAVYFSKASYSTALSLFFATSTSQGVYSSNGITWKTNAAMNNSPLGVSATGPVVVYVGNSGFIRTSSDNVTWTTRTSGTANALNAVTYKASLYVAVGNGGTIITSPDAITWTVRTSGTTSSLLDVVWSDTAGLFIVVGAGGLIRTSPDGITWTARTSGTTNTLNAVAVNTSVIVAVGQSGEIRSSTNGTAWTARTSGTTQTLYGCFWATSGFVACGNSGAVVTSPDGTTWTTRTAGGTGYQYLGGAVAGSTALLLGGSGNGITVFTSA